LFSIGRSIGKLKNKTNKKPPINKLIKDIAVRYGLIVIVDRHCSSRRYPSDLYLFSVVPSRSQSQPSGAFGVIASTGLLFLLVRRIHLNGRVRDTRPIHFSDNWKNCEIICTIDGYSSSGWFIFERAANRFDKEKIVSFSFTIIYTYVLCDILFFKSKIFLLRRSAQFIFNSIARDHRLERFYEKYRLWFYLVLESTIYLFNDNSDLLDMAIYFGTYEIKQQNKCTFCVT